MTSQHLTGKEEGRQSEKVRGIRSIKEKVTGRIKGQGKGKGPTKGVKGDSSVH